MWALSYSLGSHSICSSSPSVIKTSLFYREGNTDEYVRMCTRWMSACVRVKQFNTCIESICRWNVYAGNSGELCSYNYFPIAKILCDAMPESGKFISIVSANFKASKANCWFWTKFTAYFSDFPGNINFCNSSMIEIHDCVCRQLKALVEICSHLMFHNS